MRYGDAAHAVQAVQRESREQDKDDAYAPILCKEHDEDAAEQQQVAQHADDHLREKVREFGHVAVNALDEFAGAAVVMKAHVQAQAVAGQFGAQRVGGGPGHVFAHVGGADGDHLLEHRQPDKGQRRERQRVARAAPQGRVNKVAHDLRVEDLQANAAQ